MKIFPKLFSVFRINVEEVEKCHKDIKKKRGKKRGTSRKERRRSDPFFICVLEEKFKRRRIAAGGKAATRYLRFFTVIFHTQRVLQKHVVFTELWYPLLWLRQESKKKGTASSRGQLWPTKKKTNKQQKKGLRHGHKRGSTFIFPPNAKCRGRPKAHFSPSVWTCNFKKFISFGIYKRRLAISLAVFCGRVSH